MEKTVYFRKLHFLSRTLASIKTQPERSQRQPETVKSFTRSGREISRGVLF